MTNCTVSDCQSDSQTEAGNGGGVWNDGDLRLDGCTISGSAANRGAGLYNGVGGSVAMVNCLIFGNSAAVAGGGWYNETAAALTMANCTVTGNSSYSSSGIANYGTASIVNSIVYANPSSSPQLVGGDLAVNYSDVQWVAGVPGTGNINADPLFLAAGTDSMRLHSTSPCRDTGDPASPLDPDGSRADMGAWPFDPTLAVEGPLVPLRFLVLHNAPNPFNPSTTIRFTLPEASPVRLVVYDVRGALVRTLADGSYQPGAHSVVWDGLDRSGRACASGVYVYRLTTTQGVVTRRMTLLR
jgi:hypothetical protein